MFRVLCGIFCRAHKFSERMFSKMNYQEAVETLNTLQSNKATLEVMRKEFKIGKKSTHLEEMENYLRRADMNVNKLDELAVVHVAGTKGKGSTSAMCESILRHHGYKTGFFSSPHLVVVRERIRLNGKIISEEKFSQYFSDVFAKLNATKADSDDMPKYFHFLTVMAFHVFLQEEVDVAILEVGIGGTDDSTNIVRNPYVVGITALGLDHTSVLGNTIEEIAKAKAGIMKPGCQAYTVGQPPNAMAVLQAVSRDRKCPLHVVPNYKQLQFPNNLKPELPIDNEAYLTNASLAIQLAHVWMRKKCDNTKIFNDTNVIHNITLHPERIRKRKYSSNKDPINRNENKELGKVIYNIPMNTVSGLTSCVWPGRYQRLNFDFAEIFLDGAHTKESLDICVSWFEKQSRKYPKILVFSATGDRNSETLLTSLKTIKFDTVFFVVPAPYKGINEKSDAYSIQQHSELLSRCETHAQHWSTFSILSNKNIFIHECIFDAFKHMREIFNITNIRASVLVTGSLYLVGGALAILDPNLSSSL